MQKKVVGILASVAAAHAVLLVGMMSGGGCRQPEILGPHTFNNGPEFAEIPASTEAPGVRGADVATVPTVGCEGELAPLPPPTQAEINSLEPIAAPPVAPVKSGSSTYKVKKGDTLSVIAFKHGVSVRELAACNNLSGKAINRLRIGQELVIPDGAVYNPDRKMKARTAVKRTTKKAVKNSAKTVAAALPADGVYVVKSGDSLDRIGRRYGVTAAAIAKENNIALNKILQIGDKLRIPGKASAAAANTAPVQADKADKTPAQQPITLGDDLNTDLGTDLDKTDSSVTANGADSSTSAAPVTQPGSSAASVTDSIEVPNDTTVEEYSKQIMVSVEELRRLNPNIPADGKLKGGSYVVIPRL